MTEQQRAFNPDRAAMAAVSSIEETMAIGKFGAQKSAQIQEIIVDTIRAALSHAEGEAVDREGLADDLYLAGYSAARKERDYDPRGCDQWQAVVDAISAHPAPQAAVPEGWLIRRVDDRITVQHPDIGGYCASMDEDDRSSIAPVILYHLADAMLAAALTAPAGEHLHGDGPISGKPWYSVYQPEQPVSDPDGLPSRLAASAAKHLSNWLNMDLCECEGGHTCGVTEVRRCRDQLLKAANAPAPDEREIATYREALEKIAPYPASRTGELGYSACRRIAREALDQGDRLRAMEAREIAAPTCEWSTDEEWDGDNWESECGASWTFPDGGPAENAMKFCPECGSKIRLRAGKEGE